MTVRERGQGEAKKSLDSVKIQKGETWTADAYGENNMKCPSKTLLHRGAVLVLLVVGFCMYLKSTEGLNSSL